MSNKKGKVLVLFGEGLVKDDDRWWQQFDVVVASKKFESAIISHGLLFVDADDLIEPGSIYEASALVEELASLKLVDGSRLTKAVLYQGYELWWLYYNSLFLYFCLPYTQYKKLLTYLSDFSHIFFYRPPFGSLFYFYLQAHGCSITILRGSGLKMPTFLPFGVLSQILITFFCLPFLAIRRYRLAVFIGDKFETAQDYDFRMKFIYQELRQRKIPFVEFIRSLEPWIKVWQHVFVRRRFVVYSEAVAFLGRFCSFLFGGQNRINQKLDSEILSLTNDSFKKFKLLVATQYLYHVNDDIWAIRIMNFILRVIGIKAAYITAALERNFHTVLGCKLNNIPTVGILHGVASRFYNGYDFLPNFAGEKSLSVDKYGLWSEWWRDYYIKNSQAYKPNQLYVSGPMRPLEKRLVDPANDYLEEPGVVKVLFISEQLAVPQEVLPYLESLLKESDIKLTIIFRHYRDGFKDWLKKNNPQFLERVNLTITEGDLLAAIRANDIVVGSHSTAVLEALFQYRVPIFFKTQKWGDYFELRDYGERHPFFADDPRELIDKIKTAKILLKDDLKKLQERYFGDPYQNGSKWVVDQLVETLLKGCSTK